MNRLALTLVALMAMPLLLSATGLEIEMSFPSLAEIRSGQASWGAVSAPGRPQLPVRELCIVLPPEAENLGFTYSFPAPQTSEEPAPPLNGPFSNGERMLYAPALSAGSPHAQYLGLAKWGDVLYARFRVLPAVWQESGWLYHPGIRISLSWSEARVEKPNRIPPVLTALRKGSAGLERHFANPIDLSKWYREVQTRNYDYLIVGTPALYAAVAPLEAYRQSQGMITAFADISTILATSPGASNGDKLRNYLVSQYNQSPFTYLLLLGDHDTVPVLYLTPEPDGSETVASDFFYGDLSSIIDTDEDGRRGEYSPGPGLQDYLCDFTPEVFVGRISTNNATIMSDIATRTVAYEQSNASWKQSALLPAAFLNYAGEPEPIYLQTDGATYSEYARETVLRNWQVTTMYEQTGYLPSYPSTAPLDYTGLKNLLSTNSYGILNWSAHGSSSSSSRKVWMYDDNQNGLPDSWEMQWMSMVDRQSFDNLANPDGLILFAASCYNGSIDSQTPCLTEYALQKKAVCAVGATRTGWYKLGWANPGWGGLSSYNLHWLENIVLNGLSTGAASAFANLTHTQYYLFGDPVDADGIIWPELQNVYTYLNYGDPAIGHTMPQEQPGGEILVFEPFHHSGLPVVNALNSSGRFNVVYTDKLIPDYEYLHNLEAIFCLFGWGDTSYILEPGSLEYNLLNSYLASGGKVYLEGDVGWDPADAFWGKFGTHAPLDVVAFIEAVTNQDTNNPMAWQYDQTDPYTYVPLPNAPTATVMFTTQNTQYANHPLAVFNDTDVQQTVASAFALSRILPGENDLTDLVSQILTAFGILEAPPVESADPLVPPAVNSVSAYPNPFKTGVSLRVEIPKAGDLELTVYNLRGQKIREITSRGLAAGAHDIAWDGRDGSGQPVGPGLYFWRLSGEGSVSQGKMLKLAQ